MLDSDIIKPEEAELIKFLNSRGKYFSVPDPDGLQRLSRRFGLPEKDVLAALRASGFDLVLKIPSKLIGCEKRFCPRGTSRMNSKLRERSFGENQSHSPSALASP